MSYLCSLRPLDSCEEWIIFPQSNLFLEIRGARPPEPPSRGFASCTPTGTSLLGPSPLCNPFHHLSYHIYQYYCCNMFLFHRVVIGHSQYHSTDTRNTSLGHILQKISCVPRSSAILGLDRIHWSLPQKTYLTS